MGPTAEVSFGEYMSTEVVMPQMGESIAEGTITKWLKQVGDRVERDEPLFEISTDKVDAEIPSPAAGTLTEIRFKEGDTVEINTTVAVLDGESAGAASTTASPAKAEAAPESASKAEAPVGQPPQASPGETGAAPRLPQVEAAAATGAEVQKADESRATTATQAVTASVESKKAVSERKDATASSTDNGRSAAAEELRRTKSSPLVRKIAQEHGVDIARLEGTGLSGRVTKNDILSFIESGSPAAASAGTKSQAAQSARSASSGAIQEVPAPHPVKPAEGDRVEQMTVMRKKIAEHMVQSRRTSAHVTTVYEVDMTRIAKLREQHKDSFAERTGTKLSYMPFIFQAVTNALRKFPIFNAQVNGDQIIYKQDINLGMAVALDWGLIVPVIKRADDLSISGLARPTIWQNARARSN